MSYAPGFGPLSGGIGVNALSGGGAFSYYKAYTIDPTQCGVGGATNYPVCLGIGMGPFAADPVYRHVSRGGLVQDGNGYDIRPFADADLTIPLTFELRTYDQTLGAFEMWIRMPSVSASVGTTFYVAFGNSALVDTDGSSTSTWSSPYRAVYHFSGYAQGDATANAYDLTFTGASTGRGATYAIYTGLLVSGSHPSYAKVSAVPMTTFPLSLECWVKRTTATMTNGFEEAILALTRLASPNIDGLRFSFIRSDSSFGGTALFVQSYTDAIGTIAQSYYSLTLDTNWHHVVLVATAYNAFTVYVDGVGHAMTVSSAGGPTSLSVADTTFLGEIIYNTSTGYSPLAGALDEVRFISGAYSADAIVMDYNNQKNNSIFLTGGPLVTLVAPNDLFVTKQEPAGGSVAF